MQSLPWFSTNTGNLGDTLSRLQTQWRAILNPFIADPYLNGIQLTNIKLNNGTTVIYHTLDQLQQGWVITDINGAATVYRSEPFNFETLTLTSSAAVTVSLWVY